MVRLAILSDIHGNPIALDAVLGDIEARGGADGYLVLGDLVAQGHDPAAVLRRLASLPDARFVRGNTDRYVLTGRGPPWRRRGPTLRSSPRSSQSRRASPGRTGTWQRPGGSPDWRRCRWNSA